MEVTARAPGKIILAGEHAVVHGCTAVASSIDLYTSVSLRLRSEDEDTIQLQLNDTGLDFSWSIGRIKEVLSHLDSPFSSTPTSCSLETVKSLAALVDEKSFPESKIGLASGVYAFLCLYTSILGFKPATVVVSSELPVGAGLGSSAAYCVALSAALLALSDSMKLDVSQKGWFTFKAEAELVNKWAFEGEKIIHGRPSGVDNSVSTFGNVIKFKSGVMTRIDSNMPLRMLITNTKVGRDTKALVANVSARKSRHPDAMCSVLNAIEAISDEWSTIIQSHAVDDLCLSANEEKLGELMEMNQGLLFSIGVSHASIETILRTTMKYKLASKLTGGGGGGCVLTLLPTHVSGAVVDKLVEELESFGFQCFTAGIGGKGVQISFDHSS
ncbi:mevalonate kinase, MEVALONATE KINASE [Hibiscus trionum]|uniref:Mevalonate kinase n=1 Tax=Hibiscus trionum TaxID=183268 RepID=A0A9W7GV05_HIBTR|nr:mevalonate kinase, MEVALONATE KINASE [Hibiscus trionum]